MRVIAGKWKGRKLVGFDADNLRPTTDRVKGSLFNIWAHHIDGANWLDLYSGTGNLGWEALSRGAQHVTFVDISQKSLQVLRKNQQMLGALDEVDIVKSDVLEFLRKYKGAPFDMITIDPPFPLKICQETLEVLGGSQACGSETRIVIEHSKHEPLIEKIGALCCIDSRSYGDKLLAFYSREAN
jgi:16S rRNA (guanine966-N2)-methyltransferase